MSVGEEQSFCVIEAHGRLTKSGGDQGDCTQGETDGLSCIKNYQEALSVCLLVLRLGVIYNHIRIVMGCGILETSSDLCRLLTVFY